ncbi:unnamed protein product [Meganyctiphanes norvegica]|uniref:CRAL-TRIO domain-containing protein n=1 Tax=Meganyctiphanes norvegica TaxID=48144 RepID=A0AAV2RFJ0_MEGNR
MRGENSDVIEGDAVEVSGGHSGKTTIATHSPPLSAAASQVSLATSDLTTSDPDLAHTSSASSITSSRPPSSSDVISPDLGLPNVDDYTTETVDCPGSPQPQIEEGGKASGVCFAPDINVINEEPTEDIDDFVENNENAATQFKTGTNLLGVPPEDGPPSLGPSEGPQSLGFDVEMEDEDYFEEFHLPNTYDNAFVRHKSFRRKVNLAPIDAPDAERIEGLIVAGEFERHGSIRRKLVPEDMHNKLEKQLSEISSTSGGSENDEADVSMSSDVAGVFARDLEEIQEMLNEENNENLEDDMVHSNNIIDSVNHNKELSDKDNSSISSSDSHEVSEIQDSSELSEDTKGQLAIPERHIKRTNTSTPKSNSTSSYTSAMLDKDLNSMSEGDSPDKQGDAFLSFEDESMTIDKSTLIKIQECMDFSRLKDMYNLTGRMQDILSPEEMKNVIENADRYREYLNQDVIDVLHQSLSLSLQEKTMETNTDSGISSPHKTLSTDVKNDLRSVFEDTIESVDEGNVNESSDMGNENESKENIDNDENKDTGFVFERKRSLRIVKGNSDNEADEVEVEAVFVESDNSPRNMKRLTAPAMDFSATGSEDLDGSHDISVFSNEPPITDLETPYMPNIVLTNTDGYRGDIKQDNDSCSNLLLYDTPSAASEILTPHDFGSHSFTLTPDPDRPGSIDLNGGGGQRKLICVTKDILNSPAEEDDDISISSVCSEGILHEDTIGSISDELSRTSDNLGMNSSRRSQGSDGCQHSSPDSQSYEEPPLPPSPYKTKEEDPIPSLPPFIPELTALEESMEDRHWRSIVVGGVWRRIDMNVIAPYRKCLHHGGYMSENNQAIIVFSSCYLPNSSRRDYNYVMDNLFLYVLSTLEQLIADDYVLIYLAGGCPKNSVPSFKWLKRAYQMIDHKLRKNLKALHVVHPTMWVKTIVTLTRPFVSSKFYRKLSFINNLTELAQVVPLDQLEIPDTVQQADFELMIREKKRNMGRQQGSYITSPTKGTLSPSSPKSPISAVSPSRGIWSVR